MVRDQEGESHEDNQGIGYSMEHIIFEQDTDTELDDLDITDIEDSNYSRKSTNTKPSKLIQDDNVKCKRLYPLVIILSLIIGIIIGFGLGFMVGNYQLNILHAWK